MFHGVTALDAGTGDAAAAVFAALGHPRRLQIMRQLPATTTELRAVLMFEPREHLEILARAGVVERGAGVGGSIAWAPVQDLAARVAALLAN